MCIDEALFISNSPLTFRFYSWKRPTVSYGYFQDHQQFSEVPKNWDRVRRLTGGGAIIHHREITYSLTGPRSHSLLNNTENLYRQIHEAWKVSLEHLGAKVNFRSGCRPCPPSLWCFQKGDPLDLISKEGEKLMGSAQRRSRHRVLLHGSLPLEAQPLMGGTGLNNILKKTLSYSDALKELLNPFKNHLKIDWIQEDLQKTEKKLVEEINNHRYSQCKWVENRHFPPFLAKKSSVPLYLR